MKNQSNPKSLIFSILCFILFLSACVTHNVILQPPELKDNLPEVKTGFYLVFSEKDGQTQTQPGNPFLGSLIYLYKDKYFENEELFMGLRGSFLPNYYIKSRRTADRIEVYWQDAEESGNQGVLNFLKADSIRITVDVQLKNGSKERVELRYYQEQIWRPEVKTHYIAHRGLSYQPPSNSEGIYPANTMPAFESALASGYQGFELDVRVTKDKRFIVSHDENLNVTTTIRGKVKEKNLKDFEGILVVQSTTIPENKSTAKPAFIAAPIPPLYEVLSTFLEDERLKTVVVDIKPDTKENILTAAKADFSDIDGNLQKKILFLTRSSDVAEGLRKLVPDSDIALEGSLGTEPLDEAEWGKYYPQAVDKTRSGHNTISFGAYLVLTFNSDETARDKISKYKEMNQKYEYKSCMWSITKNWQLDFVRENDYNPDYILSDTPYYNIALQQMRHQEGRSIDTTIVKNKSWLAKSKKVYHNLLNEHVVDFWFQSRTLAELTYGVGWPKESDFSSDLAPVGNLELKLGRSVIGKYSEINVELNERFIFGSYLGSSILPADLAENKTAITSSRFGLGTIDGIGYISGGFSFVPYVSQALVWTRLKNFDNPEGSSADYDILNTYSGAFRFGDRTAYGLKTELSSYIQLNINLETAVVYPRFIFLEWTGSFLLSRIGYSYLTTFTDDIVNNFPTFGPVFNFLLRSGYLFGYYALRKNNVFWPFDSSTPLRFEMINLGISFLL